MPEQLVGRRAELRRIELFLARLPENEGGTLVLRGPAGMGKSALLRSAANSAREQGMRVLSVTGVQAETHLPFAALRQLLAPLLRGGPTTSHEAAEVIRAAASDLGHAPAVEPHRVGLAALELLSLVGEDRPACLVVDDVQWIDRPSWEALAFLGRRLQSEPVGLLVAAREGQDAVERLSGSGLPEQQVDPLSAEAAGLLLARVAPDLSDALRRMVIEAAGGNPLGLIELSATAGRLDPGHAMPVSLPLTARLEQTYATVVAGLPPVTQSLVLVAALDDGSDLDEVLAAATDLIGSAVSLDTMQPALTAGLLTTDGASVQFRHPLIRSAVRQAANVAERLAAHAALARVLPGDGDRSTWHSAAAMVGPNEGLAQRMADLAARAGRNGALDTALAAWERAAALSEDSHARADRLMWAMEAAMRRGDRPKGERLLREIAGQDLEGSQRVRFLWMREAMLGEGWSGGTRHARLLDVVERIVADGGDELALDALQQFALRNWWDPPTVEQRTAIVALADRLDVPASDHRLINVLALNAPTERAAEVVARLAEQVSSPPSRPDQLSVLGEAASGVGDLASAALLLQDAVAGSRLTGQFNSLLFALKSQAWVAAHAGEVRLAVVAAEEAQQLSQEVGDIPGAISSKLTLGLAEALRGRTTVAVRIADEAEQRLHSGDRHPFLCVIALVRAVAMLAAGRPLDAFEHARRLFDPDDVAYHPYVRLLAVAHLAEAGTLAGQGPALRPLVDECLGVAVVAPWPILTLHLRYATALLDPDPEAKFRGALAADLAAWPFERARTQMAFGEWLRRHRRPAESRPLLRAAFETFDALGVAPWAERARRELRATGETVRPAEDRTGQLTAQELQIAQLAARGLSNQEIARQLYLSPRTVSTHLYRIYPKVGVRSRSGLADVLRSS